jgi:hypothetical protein
MEDYALSMLDFAYLGISQSTDGVGRSRKRKSGERGVNPPVGIPCIAKCHSLHWRVHCTSATATAIHQSANKGKSAMRTGKHALQWQGTGCFVFPEGYPGLPGS